MRDKELCKIGGNHKARAMAGITRKMPPPFPLELRKSRTSCSIYAADGFALCAFNTNVTEAVANDILETLNTYCPR